ncbi:hypothetical protein FKW77_008423 [Venturia effusa]|uniref:Uncharacterized protein n=1 Tax=Venturia effusa TaxID=50376 RepID=A0A517KZW9_9PEZI|nr:hypothetical protein FKW77_008423 [Venturia effusa]
MPPKKKESIKQTKEEESEDVQQHKSPLKEDVVQDVVQDDRGEEADGVDNNSEASLIGCRKRKDPPTSSTSTNKAPRHSTKDSKAEPATIHQIVQYLLTQSALEQCRPNEESKALSELSDTDRASLHTYSSSVFTPFIELLCAAILSRPISHALGHRSIRTILNEPYNFTTPKVIRTAGEQTCIKALLEARTQHKGKTATEIVHIADVVTEKFGGEDDTSLEEVRKQSGHDANKERELLKASIKGVGPMALNIFFRRIQWLWIEAFPFMDEKTKDAMAALGLPDDAEELFEQVEALWDEMDTDEVAGKDEDERKRRAFTIILERALGAHLEKKTEAVLNEASKIIR